MKRYLSLFTVLCFVFLIFAVSITSWIKNRPVQIDEETAKQILTQYEAEIKYVEQQHNVSITEINDVTLDYIKETATYNLDNTDYQFGELMDELTLAMVRAKRSS